MGKSYVLFFLCFLPSFLFAQRQLRVEGGLDSNSVSTRMIDGKASARIIFESGVRLNYFTNMELTIPAANRGHMRKKGVFVDTLYFLTTPFENVRIVYLEARGYFKNKIGPIRLLPKSTYRYLVYDPGKIQKSKWRQVVSFTFSGGVNMLMDYASVGMYAGADIHILLLHRFSLVPALRYNSLWIWPEGSGRLRRDFVETNLYLQYTISNRVGVYAGYAQAYVDYSGKGFSFMADLRLNERLYLRGNYNYYTNFENSIVGLGVGIHL